jgi:hypothetical protein
VLLERKFRTFTENSRRGSGAAALPSLKLGVMRRQSSLQGYAGCGDTLAEDVMIHVRAGSSKTRQNVPTV